MGGQRAQLGAQGVKWGENEVKMGWETGWKTQPPHHQHPISSRNSLRRHKPSLQLPLEMGTPRVGVLQVLGDK